MLEEKNKKIIGEQNVTSNSCNKYKLENTNFKLKNKHIIIHFMPIKLINSKKRGIRFK